MTLEKLREIAHKATAEFPGKWISEECSSKFPNGDDCWCKWVRLDQPVQNEIRREWLVPTGSLTASTADHLCAFNPQVALALLDCAAALSAAKSELCIANCPARTHVDECTDAFNALTKLKEAGVTI